MRYDWTPQDELAVLREDLEYASERKVDFANVVVRECKLSRPWSRSKFESNDPKVLQSMCTFKTAEVQGNWLLDAFLRDYRAGQKHGKMSVRTMWELTLEIPGVVRFLQYTSDPDGNRDNDTARIVHLTIA